GRFKMIDRRVDVPKFDQYGAKIVVGDLVFWVSLGGCLKSCKGFLMLVAICPVHAKIVVGEKAAGIGLDSRFCQGLRTFPGRNALPGEGSDDGHGDPEALAPSLPCQGVV